MNAFRIALISFVAIILSTTNIQAGGSDSAQGFDPAQLLYEKVEKIESLTADFEQNTLDHEGYALQFMSGQLKLARPSKIYWKTEPPYEQLIVGDGEELWVYDPDLEQVTTRSADQMLEGPMTLLSESEAQLKNKYDIDVSSFEEREVFQLSPRAEATQSDFATLQMIFDDDRLTNITIVDRLRQKTVIDLKNVLLNTDIPNDTFKFEIPEGVDVVTNE